MDIEKLESLIDRNAKRKRPMYDQEMRTYLKTIDYSWNYPIDHYVQTFTEWLTSHKTNKLINLDAFPDRRIILGVTQAINDLYMMYPNRVVILDGEYFYHDQLFPDVKVRTLETLTNGDVLLISMPFCGENYGVHPKMPEILQKCLDENIASSASDIDFAMVMGTGYAPFRGGPLRHAHTTNLLQRTFY